MTVAMKRQTMIEGADARRWRAALPAAMLGMFALLAATVMGHAESKATTQPVTLIDEDGRTVTQDDFAGKPSLLFFGFTNCPSICPMALSEISQRLKDLGPLAAHLNVLFVTADPERDTPELLRDYTAYFDERIVGLTGERENVEALAKSLGAVIRKVPLDAGGYTVDHTSFAFLLDRQWRRAGILIIDQSVDPDRTNAKLREFVTGAAAQ
jgi:protein SCO1/2